MPALPTFPALSRQPAFGTSRDTEDGTIADPMESGYVATRPRFTRTRRKFSVTIKLLTAYEAQAIDNFDTVTVRGKAGAFTIPAPLPIAANGLLTVRFTKPPQIKESSWADNALRYDVTFEVTEV